MKAFGDIVVKFKSGIKVVLFETKRAVCNFLYCPSVFFVKNVRCRHSILKNVRFNINGDSLVTIENAILRDCTFDLLDSGCLVTIGPGCRIKGVRFYCEDNLSSINISRNSTMGGVK